MQGHGEPRRALLPGRRHLDLLARAEDRGAEYAADRLREARGTVLRDRAGVGVAAVPGRSASQPVGGEAMDGEGGERARDHHEQEHQQAVIGAAALRDRHDRQPVDADLRRHAGADQHLHRGGQRIDEETGHDPHPQAERGAGKHGGERPAVDLVRSLGRCGAGAAEEADAEGTHEAGGGERGRECEQRPRGGHQELQSP